MIDILIIKHTLMILEVPFKITKKLSIKSDKL